TKPRLLPRIGRVSALLPARATRQLESPSSLGTTISLVPNTVDRSAPAPRPPWWMYVIAASVLGCLAMEVHVFFWGPETPFARLNLRDEALVVEEVSPGTAAARAGVRAG